jgi:hypothetical protein
LLRRYFALSQLLDSIHDNFFFCLPVKNSFFRRFSKPSFSQILPYTVYTGGERVATVLQKYLDFAALVRFYENNSVVVEKMRDKPKMCFLPE